MTDTNDARLLLKELADAAESVADNESCRLDHHGNCQTHFLQNGEVCAMKVLHEVVRQARAALAAPVAPEPAGEATGLLSDETKNVAMTVASAYQQGHAAGRDEIVFKRQKGYTAGYAEGYGDGLKAAEKLAWDKAEKAMGMGAIANFEAVARDIAAERAAFFEQVKPIQAAGEGQ